MKILLIILAVLILYELVSTVVYGSWIDKDLRKSLENLFEKANIEQIRMNSYNGDIFYIYDSPSIYVEAAPILCKYQISGLGRVPRWTKLHKILKNKRKEKILSSIDRICKIN